MDPNSDFEMEEMRDMAAGMGHPRSNKGNGSRRFPLAVILVAMGLAAVFFTFYNCGDKGTSEELSSVIASLDELEKRVSKQEERTNTIGRLEEQIQALKKTVATMEDNELSMSREFGKMNKEAGQMKAEIALLTQKIGTAPKPQAKAKPVSQPKQKVHEVKKGDTLYGIASRYGLTVDELRRLNKFSRDEAIFPGQVLVVK